MLFTPCCLERWALSRLDSTRRMRDSRNAGALFPSMEPQTRKAGSHCRAAISGAGPPRPHDVKSAGSRIAGAGSRHCKSKASSRGGLQNAWMPVFVRGSAAERCGTTLVPLRWGSCARQIQVAVDCSIHRNSTLAQEPESAITRIGLSLHRIFSSPRRRRASIRNPAICSRRRVLAAHTAASALPMEALANSAQGAHRSAVPVPAVGDNMTDKCMQNDTVESIRNLQGLAPRHSN